MDFSEGLPYEALVLAINGHNGQTRKNGSGAYAIHPFRCGKMLKDEGETDPTVIAGAFVHDLDEDTDIKLPQIKEKLGEEVAEIVRQVSDNKELDPGLRKLLQILHAIDASVKALKVKLADGIDNIEDMLSNPPKGWTKERIQNYIVWKVLVFHYTLPTEDPIVHNLLRRFYRAIGGNVEIESVNQDVKTVETFPALPDYFSAGNNSEIIAHMKNYFEQMSVEKNRDEFELCFQQLRSEIGRIMNAYHSRSNELLSDNEKIVIPVRIEDDLTDEEILKRKHECMIWAESCPASIAWWCHHEPCKGQ